MKGFINIYKPEGMSSAFAVGQVKKKFKMPCGHMGTLDPMACGVLPVGIGKTSRLFPYLLDKEKKYVAHFRFGVSTDTLDITGKVLSEGGSVPSIQQIKSVLHNFVGEIDQIPPKYSANHVSGKRGYELARKGVEFELAPKKVSVLSLTCDGELDNGDYKFTIICKGGTYIRSLARDIGIACNTTAVMSYLCREQCGIFNLENSVTIDKLKECENLESLLLPPQDAVPFNSIVLTGKQAQKILDGVYEDYGFQDGIYKVFNGEDFWGVGQVEKGKLVIKSYVR